MKNKNKSTFIVTSNCLSPTTNIRINYVKKLQEHLNIDIFGKSYSCLNSKPLPCEELGNCIPNLMNQTYKFYLAFENSICKEYNTEKLGRALKYGTLPIILGSSLEDVTKIAPPNSFLHVDNFTSPKELADYVKFLDSNFEAYKAYFKWREFYKVDYFMIDDKICSLCKKLHEHSKSNKKNTVDLKEALSVKNNCVSKIKALTDSNLIKKFV